MNPSLLFWKIDTERRVPIDYCLNPLSILKYAKINEYRIMSKIINLGLVSLLTFFLVQSAMAIEFKDESLKVGKVITLESAIEDTEIHADSSIGNIFHNAQNSSLNNGYDGILDYRIEAHTPLFKFGTHKASLVTRVEGFGFFDNNIKNFLDDPLIDIPELYVQDDFKIKNLDTKIVFGKFANRRFFDKNEIMTDPFDIGERPFFGAIASVNTILASIETARDADQLNSIQATGSYGFYFSIKDNHKKGFLGRWGYKQSLTVAQTQDFGNNFYGISEINKNWGDKRPGQFDIGALYAQNEVFRVARAPGVSGNPAYLFYSSVVQKINSRLSAYAKYGFLANNDASGNNFYVNNVVSGAALKLTDKDTVGTNIVFLDSTEAPHSISHLNSWTHKFTSNFYSTVFATFRYNAPTTIGPDNNWFIGVNLTGLF